MDTFGNSTWLWTGFTALIIFMLSLDLGLFNRKAHTISYREASIWSGVWVALGAVFAGIVFLSQGSKAGLEFVTGYVIELSLSVDNLFVFILIFSYFKVPKRYQHRVLFWGLLGALVLRLTMIFLGAALITRFSWILYIFGAFLIYTGLNMFREENKDLEPEKNPVVRLVTRFVPMTRNYHEDKFFTVVRGRKVGTLLLLVLVIVEVTDLVFAVDSIPAIFAITTNTFIVYTSNVFAILGLRSMYFLLAGVIEKFHYLRTGLAIVLTFIGVKMLIVIAHVEIPIYISLIVVVGVLLSSIVASVIWAKEQVRATKVRIQGANPPLFVLSGSGTLAHLVIYDSRRSNEEEDQSCAIWEIEPIAGYRQGRPLEEIGTVQYGQLPDGYRQVCPENGNAPPALAKGNKYEYWFDTSDAPHARRYFVIRGTKAVEVVD
ncbi:MAG TPA: TerC family protein [Pyrinomonadaceae bacterium]|nr:TerC family protein [Pyrinomonadaceae bacterium]